MRGNEGAAPRLRIVLDILKIVVLPASLAILGILGNAYLKRQEAYQQWLQAGESNVRLYTELMTRREEADSSLRKEMFNSTIATFLSSGRRDLGLDVLNLELLTYNFHEVFDLGPLFRHVDERIGTAERPQAATLRRRLERAATEVSGKQIAALEPIGGKLDGAVDFSDLASRPEGIRVIDGTLPLQLADADHLHPATRSRNFKIYVLAHDEGRREIRVKLVVQTPRAGTERGDTGSEADFVYSVFWVGFFDFPQIDNTRLSYGDRCAVVLRRFNPVSAEMTLVYFPGQRASLKERPYFDEVVSDLLRTRALGRGSPR
jgi:hypothetical protein